MAQVGSLFQIFTARCGLLIIGISASLASITNTASSKLGTIQILETYSPSLVLNQSYTEEDYTFCTPAGADVVSSDIPQGTLFRINLTLGQSEYVFALTRNAFYTLVELEKFGESHSIKLFERYLIGDKIVTIVEFSNDTQNETYGVISAEESDLSMIYIQPADNENFVRTTAMNIFLNTSNNAHLARCY